MDGVHGSRQTARMDATRAMIHPVPPPWLRQGAYGFIYWLAFLLVLEPGNLMRASEMGAHLVLSHETARMLGAALIGAMTTPAMLLLGDRFPISGQHRLRNLLFHGLGVAGFALGLILLSCVLAAWAFSHTWLPTLGEIYWQVADNWLLLVYALIGQAAVARLLSRVRTTDDDAPSTLASTAARPLSHVTTKVRGRQVQVALDQVDWLETQGNYLALHVGDATYLIRQTITAFEVRLDPRQFARVHRRAMVCLHGIQDLKPLTNGDAELRLRTGQVVRVSRSYRKQLAASIEQIKVIADSSRSF
ncbi:LytTR family transcriptional regulator [Dyella terrae]|nr:LytTR family transcriptional regulator [Dyella terrae]